MLTRLGNARNCGIFGAFGAFSRGLGRPQGPPVGFSLGGVSGKALGRSRGVSLAYQYCPLSAFSLKKGGKRLQGQKRKDAAESLPPRGGFSQRPIILKPAEGAGGITTVSFRCDRFRECPLIATDVGVHQCWTPQKKGGRQCASLTSPSMTIGGSNVLLSPGKGASDCDAPLMVSIVWISLMPIRNAALSTALPHVGSKAPRTEDFLKRGCLAWRISSKMRP